MAVVSGAIDFGVTGLTAGFYNLGGQGALRIIGAQGRESPGFHTLGYFASSRPTTAASSRYGARRATRSAITGTGTPGHYAVGAPRRNTASPLEHPSSLFDRVPTSSRR